MSANPRDSILECLASAEVAYLPHTCPESGADEPIPYPLGPRARERLTEGETLPATARCRRCDRRVFISLVDSTARAARRAAARPDPTALRPPKPSAAARRPLPPPISIERYRRPTAAPCPACGAVPDDFGICRCSL